MGRVLLMAAAGLGFVGADLAPSLSAQPLVLTFGKPQPSIVNGGTFLTFEDAAQGVAIETFANLPRDIAPLFGFTLVEAHFTTMGVLRGRRISVFEPTDELTPALDKRLAYMDFDDNGRLEAYQLFVDPKHWLPHGRIMAATPEAREFLAHVFYSSDQSPAVLRTPISVEEEVYAPRGLLSPQLSRPAYKLTKESDGLERTVVFQVTRAYSREGYLTTFGARLFALHVQQQTRAPEVAFALAPLDVQANSGETSIVETLQIAKPCHKALNALKNIEGRIHP